MTLAWLLVALTHERLLAGALPLRPRAVLSELHAALVRIVTRSAGAEVLVDAVDGGTAAVEGRAVLPDVELRVVAIRATDPDVVVERQREHGRVLGCAIDLGQMHGVV